MIFESLISMKNDLREVLFYWVTFFVTAMFIFLFHLVAMSDGIGVTIINSRNDLPTNLMIFSVILCSIDIVFANHFFVRKKAQQLASRLICGATFFQLARYLLFQTVLILVLAIPAGLACAIWLLPFLNRMIVLFLHSNFQIVLSDSAVLWTMIVLGYVVFWTLVLDISYTYRNSASELLKETKIEIPMEDFIEISNHLPHTLLKYISLLVFLFPILGFYENEEKILTLSFISLVGFFTAIYYYVLPMIEKQIHIHRNQASVIASLGFVRSDLKKLRLNIVLFLISAVILISMLSSAKNAMEKTLVIMTYMTMSVLLSLGMMFQFSSDISGRIRYYRSLSNIGFTKRECRKVIRSEIGLLYGFVGIAALFYMLNIFGALLMNGMILLRDSLLLVMITVVPLGLCAVIHMLYYSTKVFQKK